ncbi:50S ribosomal protein L10 [Candidatus Azambacteria bacterium]|nr:50S ribosomal protein L10 [Candidatus Azambacteria bacterium]
MALTRKQKEEILDAVKERFQEQKSVVFTDFTGISVAQSSDLKRKLKETNTEYKVVKKNLLAKAIEDLKIEGVDAKSFTGSMGVAFSYDEPAAPAKIIYDFSKQEGIGEFKILGGILDGIAISAGQVQALAKLPSKDQLRANLLAQMNAPISGFVNVLAGNIKNLIYALNAIKEKKA